MEMNELASEILTKPKNNIIGFEITRLTFNFPVDLDW